MSTYIYVCIVVGNYRNGYKHMYICTCIRICSLDALRLLLFHSISLLSFCRFLLFCSISVGLSHAP